MKVSEIFTSIEGEGLRVGLPATFIRLYGCNLQCSYCDSQYACTSKEYTEMTVDEIIKAVEEKGISRVTLTGGEPMIHEGIQELIDALNYNGYDINIETNGSVLLSQFDFSRNCNSNELIITMDWKSISSGMSSMMCVDNLSFLDTCDVVKFVVGSQADLDQALEIINMMDELVTPPQVYISPVFGKIEPKEIVEFILKNHLENVRVQLQIHKIIWDPDQRGV